MSVPTTRRDIDQFLAIKRLAVIGVSRDSKEFSHQLFQEFRGRGYNALPVNPNAQELEGERCFARVQEIQPAPETALILTSLDASAQAVLDCAEAGVKQVWLYGVSGPANVNAQALETAREKGLVVIPGFCPYMFLPNSAFQHRVHGWVAKMTGSSPK